MKEWNKIFEIILYEENNCIISQEKVFKTLNETISDN